MVEKHYAGHCKVKKYRNQDLVVTIFNIKKLQTSRRLSNLHKTKSTNLNPPYESKDNLVKVVKRDKLSN